MSDTRRILSDHAILVVVPTYNNAGTLGSVLEQIREYSDDLLVVNDGSTDNTMSVIETMNVNHITYSPNRGKGYAIRRAFRYARDNGYDYVITIDSDGQHYVSDLEKFASHIDSYNDSLIIGARNLTADNMPSKNTFANKFSNFWYFIETGKKLQDTQSGYRLYPMRKLGDMRFFSNRYEFEVESIVRATWNGVNVCNIPINVYYPSSEERISHFKPFKDFMRISILNSVLVLIAFLFYYPWRFVRSFTKDNVKSFIKKNVTDTNDSNRHISASVGLGVFFGIIPIWGYQMIAAGVTAHFLRLNKVLTVISSNISIPPMIPFILYGSFYTGALLLGTDMKLNFSGVSFQEVYKDMLQYVYGSLVFAFVSAIAATVLTYILLLIFRRNVNG